MFAYTHSNRDPGRGDTRSSSSAALHWVSLTEFRNGSDTSSAVHPPGEMVRKRTSNQMVGLCLSVHLLLGFSTNETDYGCKRRWNTVAVLHIDAQRLHRLEIV